MSAAPPWNSRDPGASLEALWEFLHAHARDVLAKDGSHVEMLFVVGGDGTLQPQPLVPPNAKGQAIPAGNVEERTLEANFSWSKSD